MRMCSCFHTERNLTGEQSDWEEEDEDQTRVSDERESLVKDSIDRSIDRRPVLYD